MKVKTKVKLAALLLYIIFGVGAWAICARLSGWRLAVALLLLAGQCGLLTWVVAVAYRSAREQDRRGY